MLHNRVARIAVDVLGCLVVLITTFAPMIAHAAGGHTPFTATFGVCPQPAPVWADHHKRMVFTTDSGVRISATPHQMKKFAIHPNESIVATVTPPGADYQSPDTLNSVTSTTWQLTPAQTKSCAAIAASKASGSRSEAYTVTGGYYSAGKFYPLASDTLTITVAWRYNGGKITSYRVTYTTTIPTTQQPRFVHTYTPNGDKTVLTATVTGVFATNVLNNTGSIGVTGTFTGAGDYGFTPLSSNGG